MTDEVIGNAHTFAPTPDAPALAKAKLLVLTSGDGLAPGMDALVAKGREAGGTTVKTPHVAADHGGPTIASRRRRRSWTGWRR